jgi:orotidine-5'-phosphate decarboxylase
MQGRPPYTPYACKAMRTEADFIVVGRPITAADNIMDAIERLYSELQ